jgi:phosphotransferase system enzyme I (PtsI)
LALIKQAKADLDAQNIPYGNIKIGAMIEIPAAALMMPTFLKYFDFLSIGTNDLIQYTLAIDRADEAVAHMYDPLHPAVLHLISNTIQQCRLQGKEVSVCGEMAGDVSLTRLLLGMGLRSFSMHPAQILTVKQQILRTDTSKLNAWIQQVLSAENPSQFV